MLLSMSCFILPVANEYNTNMYTFKAVSVMSLLLTFETFSKQSQLAPSVQTLETRAQMSDLNVTQNIGSTQNTNKKFF